MATVTTCHICAHAWYLWLYPKFSGVSNRLYHVTALKKWVGLKHVLQINSQLWLLWNTFYVQHVSSPFGMIPSWVYGAAGSEPRGTGLYTAIALELGDLPRANSAMKPLKHRDLRLAFQSLGRYWVPEKKPWEGKWKITDYLALFIICYLSKYLEKHITKKKSCWVWLLLKKYNPAVAGWNRVQNDATCPVEIGQPRC